MVTEADARESGEAEPLAFYAYTPRAFGREIRLTLRESALEVNDQRRTTVIPLADIETVRLAFQPRGVMTRCFTTAIAARNGRKASFASLTAKSMLQIESQPDSYRRFLAALLAAVARANPACRFAAGRPPAMWTALALVSAASLAAVIYLVAILAPQMSVGGAVGALALGAVSAWTVVEMVARNRPRRFAPDAPPPDLLP
ncbi:MAG: hypothetical protein J0H41_11755 [Rhizobiales bacterium]|nr:hypothetical protein [Hyphomicrobiales bacterium]